MSVDVKPVVDELAAAGTRGFRASLVARELSSPIEPVRKELMRLVEAGILQLKFELLCRDDGRTIRSYRTEEDLPLGQWISDDSCESDEGFQVEKSDIWVLFKPTRGLIQRVTEQRCKKKQSLR